MCTHMYGYISHNSKMIDAFSLRTKIHWHIQDREREWEKENKESDAHGEKVQKGLKEVKGTGQMRSRTRDRDGKREMRTEARWKAA